MKKTLLLSEIFPPVKGGSGRWFWEIYNRIDLDRIVIAAGHTDGVVAFDEQSQLKTYRLPLTSKSWGIKDHMGLMFYWHTYWKVRKLIKRQEIEVVHCGRCLPEGFVGYLLYKTLRIPYLCYIHGEDVETASSSRELRWIVLKALSNAKYLICNSQNTANILCNKWKIDIEKIKVIHPGVDATRFVPAPANPEVRHKLGWRNRPVILTVGRLQKRKGQDMMIKSLPLIKEKYPDILYAIVGDGEQRSELEQLVEELSLQKNVLFTSEVSDTEMIQCYQQCDIFILPNRTVNRDIEGFGMVLVEAQACAKPVVAGNSGGTAETMMVGETGLIIECTQPKLITQALISLLNNSKKCMQMGKKGRNHVCEKLDWITLAQKAKNLFTQL